MTTEENSTSVLIDYLCGHVQTSGSCVSCFSSGLDAFWHWSGGNAPLAETSRTCITVVIAGASADFS